MRSKAPRTTPRGLLYLSEGFITLSHGTSRRQAWKKNTYCFGINQSSLPMSLMGATLSHLLARNNLARLPRLPTYLYRWISLFISRLATISLTFIPFLTQETEKRDFPHLYKNISWTFAQNVHGTHCTFKWQEKSLRLRLLKIRGLEWASL